MLKFTLRQLLLTTAFVAALISLYVAYDGWRHTFHLTDVTVSFSVDGERLSMAKGAIQVPASKLKNNPLRMDWHYTFANHSGASDAKAHSVYLHADRFFDGIHLRQTSTRITSQGTLTNRDLSSRLYWSSETVSDGCVVYVAVHLYDDGKLTDTQFKEFRLALESSAE